MRRLLTILLILFVICTVGISSVRLVARTQSLPERLSILHLDYCAAPCWIGIIPKYTTGQEAEEILSRFYPLPQFVVTKDTGCSTNDADCFNIGRSIQYQYLFRAYFLRGTTGKVSETITSIHLSLGDVMTQTSDYTFGDFYSLLGEPVYSQTATSLKYAKYGEIRGGIYLNEDGILEVIGFDGDLDTRPTKRVRHLRFMSYQPSDGFDLASMHQRLLPWQGFMSSQRVWTKFCARRGLC